MARNEPKIYHHSNVKGVVVRIIIIVIAAAFILALTAFFGFRKFIAYTDTGKLYLDIPWLYGYMDGPPATDDLAPYMAPVETSKPAGNTSALPDTTSQNEPSEESETLTPDGGENTAQQDSTTDIQ